MVWFIGILIGVVVALLLLFLILILSKVTVEIFFTYADHRKDLFIKIKMLKFIKIKRTIPVMEINTDTLSLAVVEQDQFMNKEKENNKSFNIDDFKKQWTVVDEVIHTTRDVIPHFKKAMYSVKLKYFKWDTLVGLKSAHHTAIITGCLYSVKGICSSVLTEVLHNETIPTYTIQPHYSRLTYQTEFKCIFSFQIGKIMRELYSIVKKYGQIKKVGTK
ncbi:hypothetical protein E3U55_01250 [Filobacillus milosensis]|uniref:DUF2953 domain-containing protein n=1 Tax=Filobacillus milosensis TaxID=94137 RepID=A0A4Y8ISX2_9BACI|nr:hypothetical protein [Filobacillus milosensis]TFB25048.1 hypothetical protein E3U55_01250 [Filobacillus milosensis]